jgi:hypothetical protein
MLAYAAADTVGAGGATLFFKSVAVIGLVGAPAPVRLAVIAIGPSGNVDTSAVV